MVLNEVKTRSCDLKTVLEEKTFVGISENDVVEIVWVH